MFVTLSGTAFAIFASLFFLRFHHGRRLFELSFSDLRSTAETCSLLLFQKHFNNRLFVDICHWFWHTNIGSGCFVTSLVISTIKYSGCVFLFSVFASKALFLLIDFICLVDIP